MVTVVSGKLGAGKSYDCVRSIVAHLSKGGCVRTNIRLSSSAISERVGRKIFPAQIGILSADDDPKLIPTGDRRGHGVRRVMVVLDEALNWFQSSKASDDDSKKQTWGEWLRQSDKLGQDVFFIAQNFERAAKWIRELAQCAIEIVPLREVRILGIPIFKWGLFKGVYIRSVWDVRSRKRLYVDVFRQSSFIWDLYDTAETFGFQGASSVYDSFVRFPPFTVPLLPFFLPLLGIAVIHFFL